MVGPGIAVSATGGVIGVSQTGLSGSEEVTGEWLHPYDKVQVGMGLVFRGRAAKTGTSVILNISSDGLDVLSNANIDHLRHLRSSVKPYPRASWQNTDWGRFTAQHVL